MNTQTFGGFLLLIFLSFFFLKKRKGWEWKWWLKFTKNREIYVLRRDAEREWSVRRHYQESHSLGFWVVITCRLLLESINYSLGIWIISESSWSRRRKRASEGSASGGNSCCNFKAVAWIRDERKVTGPFPLVQRISKEIKSTCNLEQIGI